MNKPSNIQKDQMIKDNYVEYIREFNRFYTRLIGLLDEGLLKSNYSLTEARIIYELGIVKSMTAKEIGQILGLDSGYLSRILTRLIKSAIICKRPDDSDKRQLQISLTMLGKVVHDDLRQRSRDEIRNLFNDVGKLQTHDIVTAMAQIKNILNKPSDSKKSYSLRDPEIGDLSFIAYRQAQLYNLEYGFDQRFEAIVTRVVSDYITQYNAKLDKCWVAEVDDKIAGSIFCVNGGDGVAKLRLLYVEPSARGMGIGNKLVAEVEKFARKKKYSKLTFWTVDCLPNARRIYEAQGFKLINEQPETEFGDHINRQFWEKWL